MKKIQLASLILFGVMAFACEKTMAQTQQKKDQQTTNQADPNVATQDNSGAAPATDPNSGAEPTNVTIDSTASGTAPASTEPSSAPVKSESATKIHIYSGKHDGNNVINPDPKN